jgi:ASC-1-like (ASCH) protein
MEITVMRVQSPWFEDIQAGIKTVEGRVGPLAKHSQTAGQRVKIEGIENINVSFYVTVIKVVHYDTLGQYLIGCGWENVAPHVTSHEAAVAAYRAIRDADGNEVFSDANISACGGINALHLKL